MSLQGLIISKDFCTEGARKCCVSSVTSHMWAQTRWAGKRLCTLMAGKGFLTSVNSHMSFQILSISKWFFAYGTMNQLLCNLCFQTLMQGAGTCWRLCVQQGINCFFYCRLSRVLNIPICSSNFSVQSESGSSGAFASYKETETVSILLPPFQSLHHI
jgi:hypothetical protein